MSIVLAPHYRYAVIGKTGSGKTTFSVVLACLLVPPDDPKWQVWWLDSKRDNRDQAMLKRWGFRTDRNLGHHVQRRLITLDPKDGPIEWQANKWAERAITRKHVLLVHDEYKHQTLSTRRAGPGIEDVHLRGRGLNVGQLGETQEPCDIPRQLLSQATHIFLFDLTYPNDVKYARTLYADYQRPEHRKGFYHAYIDGDAEWRYYPHVRAWHDQIVTGQEQAS